MKEEERKPGVNPAHKVAERLRENRQSLHIARVPEKTKKQFIELAEEEFCGDYGMTLKWLMDDIPNLDIRMIIAKLEEHESRISVLESIPKEEKPKKKTRKMLDGTIKNIGGKEDE